MDDNLIIDRFNSTTVSKRLEINYKGEIMANFRAIVHYNLKKGMEEKGLKFLENELIKHANEFGCHSIEILQSQRDPMNIVGIATWNSLEDAREFQGMWAEKEQELIYFCTSSPKREFFKIRNSYQEKMRKAA